MVEDPNFLHWAVSQGGAFGVVLVILFFYRRDWKTAVEFWRDQHATTVDLVRLSTEAQVKTTAALAENTTVMHSLKRAVEVNFIDQRREPRS